MVSANRAVVRITEVLVRGAYLLYPDPQGQKMRTLQDALGRDSYTVLWDLGCLRLPAAPPLPPPSITVKPAPRAAPSTRTINWSDEDRRAKRDEEVAASIGDSEPGAEDDLAGDSDGTPRTLRRGRGWC